ncbi:hypothetical protein CRE_30684 [Caenorhabditis remanei]|uniref:Uncharacterized protein n=1 Tax=Caenorhabditis remanei TaxID=31234 RepID=E3LTQ6_CAERE|nr:hypothetical protein CRE_30684 [Caenorhabditis remanei]
MTTTTEEADDVTTAIDSNDSSRKEKEEPVMLRAAQIRIKQIVRANKASGDLVSPMLFAPDPWAGENSQIGPARPGPLQKYNCPETEIIQMRAPFLGFSVFVRFQSRARIHTIKIIKDEQIDEILMASPVPPYS